MNGRSISTKRVVLIAITAVVIVIAAAGAVGVVQSILRGDPKPDYNTSTTLEQDIDLARQLVNATRGCAAGNLPDRCKIEELREAVHGIVAKSELESVQRKGAAFTFQENLYDGDDCSNDEYVKFSSCRQWSAAVRNAADEVVRVAQGGYASVS